jgi:hypothetical protein
VTLDYPASKVHIGLPFPALLQDAAARSGQDEGVARGKLKRMLDLDLHVVETQGIRVSVQGCDPIPVETRDRRRPAGRRGAAVHRHHQDPDHRHLRGIGQVEIERFQPTPGDAVAVVPTIEVGER